VVFDAEIYDKRPGICVVKVTGKDVFSYFQNESGIHQVQRVPPTEKRGRTHTSSISIAIMKVPTQNQITILDSDVDIKTCRGSGAGSQHRNVTDSAVVLTHIPTGIMVRCESERSQLTNKERAMDVLRAKLFQMNQQKLSNEYNQERKNQIASQTKRRTIRFQDNIVVDHITNKTITIKQLTKGDLINLQ